MIHTSKYLLYLHLGHGAPSKLLMSITVALGDMFLHHYELGCIDSLSCSMKYSYSVYASVYQSADENSPHPMHSFLLFLFFLPECLYL